MLIQLSLAACLLIAVNGSPTTTTTCPSTIEHHPYIVSIEYDNIHVGGGSIISSHFILTTAPVVFEATNLDLLTVRTGSNFSNRHGNVHNVCNARIHPTWNNNSYDYVYGLALIRLVKPIVFDPTRQPIRLFYGSDAVDAGKNVSLSAWQNLFTPGKSENASLTILEGSFKENCTEMMTGYGVLCMERHFESGWHRLAGRGHPVVDDGMQAAVLVSSDESNNRTYFVDTAYYDRWIDETMKEMNVESCYAECDGK